MCKFLCFRTGSESVFQNSNERGQLSCQLAAFFLLRVSLNNSGASPGDVTTLDFSGY
jgi:hypothetical protein